MSPSGVVRFQVFGEPRPKGSKRALPVRRRDGSQTVALVEEGGAALQSWRTRLAAAVAEHRPEGAPWPWPVVVEMTFYLRPPKRPRASWPVARGRGDVDKLARAVLDELTGVVIVDDGQVVHLNAAKAYGDAPGVEVGVWALGELERQGGRVLA